MGWLAVGLAMVWRTHQGLGIPPLNTLFIFAGLGAYFLPTCLGERERAEAVRRKLLWLLLLAGLIILAGEVARSFGLLEQG
jgi:hypothetical protein